jgi:hypothetical protein
MPFSTYLAVVRRLIKAFWLALQNPLRQGLSGRRTVGAVWSAAWSAAALPNLAVLDQHGVGKPNA